MQDILFVWRSFRRQPAFALTALAMLTLGIGANTAIFSLVNAVLLRPVPYPDPERIVEVGTNTAPSVPKFAAWRQQRDRHHTTRSVLVIAEMTFAVALLIGAALLIRSLAALRAVDPGIDHEQVLTMRMSMKDVRYATTAGVSQLVDEGIRRLRAVPGAVAAGAANCLPVQGYLNLRFTIIGRPSQNPYHAIAQWGIVSPGTTIRCNINSRSDAASAIRSRPSPFARSSASSATCTSAS